MRKLSTEKKEELTLLAEQLVSSAEEVLSRIKNGQSAIRCSQNTIKIATNIELAYLESKHMKQVDLIFNMWNKITGNIMTGDKSIKEYRKMILSLIKDGFVEDEFSRVFHVKTWEWKGDVDMEKYLRPETVFLKSKFKKYVKETEFYEKNRPAAKALMLKYQKRNGVLSRKKSRFIN